MERNLKNLLINYYQVQQCENAIREELEKMLDNPVVYNKGTEIDHIQEVLDYQTEIQNLEVDIDNFYQSGRVVAASIASSLEMIGVPPGRKITIKHDEITNLNFWYDEYDTYYELAV